MKIVPILKLKKANMSKKEFSKEEMEAIKILAKHSRSIEFDIFFPEKVKKYMDF